MELETVLVSWRIILQTINHMQEMFWSLVIPKEDKGESVVNLFVWHNLNYTCN